MVKTVWAIAFLIIEENLRLPQKGGVMRRLTLLAQACSHEAFRRDLKEWLILRPPQPPPVQYFAI
ncbi:hypothetical protein [Streptomyces vastus]|uniref:Transposase n=1 Tax=Streptomyces vastus TaxID=285451 RepID=A0ABP6D5W2_9ACTN